MPYKIVEVSPNKFKVKKKQPGRRGTKSPLSPSKKGPKFFSKKGLTLTTAKSQMKALYANEK